MKANAIGGGKIDHREEPRWDTVEKKVLTDLSTLLKFYSDNQPEVFEDFIQSVFDLIAEYPLQAHDQSYLLHDF